jgi:hypothetical protein
MESDFGQKALFITLGGPQAHDSSCRKTFPGRGVNTEISPLRYASVEMTKGRTALPWRATLDRRRFSSPWVGRRPMTPPIEKHFQEGASTQRSLRCAPPDFLYKLVTLADIMRLSLKKGAHVASASAAWQEIRVPPACCSHSGNHPVARQTRHPPSGNRPCVYWK